MSDTSKRSPWADLLSLLLITFVCLFIVSLFFSVIALTLSEGKGFLPEISGDHTLKTYYVYLQLGISSAGAFLVPAYIYQLINKQNTIFPNQNLTDWKPYFLGLLFLFIFAPCMSLVAEWNMQMKLPEIAQQLEQWMRSKEDEMALWTEHIVMTTAWNRLFLNIVVVGILPGIGEELFFRGALQQIGTRIFKNEYVAVWVIAFIFSAIHIQFYGFFPRLLLGVFFGYMVVWTKNIWTAVVAHFVNNSMVVIWAFYFATQGKSYAELMKSDSYSLIVYLGSLVFSGIIAFIFYRYITRIKLYGKRVD